MSSATAADPVADGGCAFDMSSPHSLRMSMISSGSRPTGVHHDYNFSGSTYDESTDEARSTEDEFAPDTEEEEEEMILEEISHPDSNPGPGLDRAMHYTATSRHSSVSSFPASVIHHHPLTTYKDRPQTPTKSPFGHINLDIPPYTSRAHSTGFRHPSSVRALQMRDEYEFTDLEDLTPHHRRDSRLSYLSYRSSGSAHSSPTKSLRSKSAQSSPYKQGKTNKAKKEFPLVLLHCTLLPPPLFLRANVLSTEKEGNDSVLEAIIPEPYARRWKALQDKVVRNPEVKTRGVLIPHPREDYELLEEKLLETLDLETPRIRNGHFVAGDDRPPSAVDSGFESAGSASSTTGDDGPGLEEVEDKCPDCGHDFGNARSIDKNWEVKVFAANGLMKAGAWSAAWSEMEKVDVEVSLWMPEHIQKEVDNRLEALINKEMESRAAKKLNRRKRRGMDEEREREIYGEPTQQKEEERPNQDEINTSGAGCTFEQSVATATLPLQQAQSSPPFAAENRLPNETSRQADQDLVSALTRYASLLASDRRNIAITLLSLLILFTTLNNSTREMLEKSASAVNNPISQVPTVETVTHVVQSTSISVSTVLSTVTSIASAFESDAVPYIHDFEESATDDTKLAKDQVIAIEADSPGQCGSNRADQSKVSHVASFEAASPDTMLSFNTSQDGALEVSSVVNEQDLLTAISAEEEAEFDTVQEFTAQHVQDVTLPEPEVSTESDTSIRTDEEAERLEIIDQSTSDPAWRERLHVNQNLDHDEP